MTARRERIFLVTGGSGLLGSRLVRRLLEEGQRVRVLDARIGELRDIRTFMEASQTISWWASAVFSKGQFEHFRHLFHSSDSTTLK